MFVSDPILVLIEYIPYGDLLGFLRKSRGLNDTYYTDPDVKPRTNLTPEQMMQFAWQIADGMSYLSSNKVQKGMVVRPNDEWIWKMCVLDCISHCISRSITVNKRLKFPRHSVLARSLGSQVLSSKVFIHHLLLMNRFFTDYPS